MPRVIWSSGNCMLYVRAEPSVSEKRRTRETSEKEREKSREQARRANGDVEQGGREQGGKRVCEKSRLIRAREAEVSRDGRGRKRARGRRGVEPGGRGDEGKGVAEEVREEEPRRGFKRRGGEVRHEGRLRGMRTRETQGVTPAEGGYQDGPRGKRRRVCENAISGLLST